MFKEIQPSSVYLILLLFFRKFGFFFRCKKRRLFHCICVQKLGPPSAADLAQLRSLTPPHAWSQFPNLGGAGSRCFGASTGPGDLILQGSPLRELRALEFQRLMRTTNQ